MENISTTELNTNKNIGVSLNVIKKIIKILITYVPRDDKMRPFVKKTFQLFERYIKNNNNGTNDTRTLLSEIVLLLSKEFLDHSDMDVAYSKLLTITKYTEVMIEIKDFITDTRPINVDEIENEITNRLNFIFVGPKLQTLSELMSNYDSVTMSEFIDKFQKHIGDLNRQIMAKKTKVITIPELTLDDNEDVKAMFEEAHKNIKQKTKYIRTGIKKLNELLNGGFERKRVVVLAGCTGGGKSMMLLNIAIWACKYNKFTTNKPHRKPMVVYLSQENDMYETQERLMTYANNTGKAIEELGFESLYDALFVDGVINEHCKLHLMYRPKNSIDTGDLEHIIDELESDGKYEVVMMVHDYLQRIAPPNATGTAYSDLGNVVNDFSIIAKARDIAFITAHQLNRQAYSELMGKDGDGKLDGVNKIGLQHMSDSVKVSENSDLVLLIHKEHLEKENKSFMTFKILKNRSSKKVNTASNTQFAQPFCENNNYRLVEDCDDETSRAVRSVSAYNQTDGKADTKTLDELMSS